LTLNFVEGKRERRAKERLVEVTMQDHSTTEKTQDFIQEKRERRDGVQVLESAAARESFVYRSFEDWGFL
jgi:hypothetical protein